MHETTVREFLSFFFFNMFDDFFWLIACPQLAHNAYIYEIKKLKRLSKNLPIILFLENLNEKYIKFRKEVSIRYQILKLNGARKQISWNNRGVQYSCKSLFWSLSLFQDPGKGMWHPYEGSVRDNWYLLKAVKEALPISSALPREFTAAAIQSLSQPQYKGWELCCEEKMLTHGVNMH